MSYAHHAVQFYFISRRSAASIKTSRNGYRTPARDPDLRLSPIQVEPVSGRLAWNGRCRRRNRSKRRQFVRRAVNVLPSTCISDAVIEDGVANRCESNRPLSESENPTEVLVVSHNICRYLKIRTITRYGRICRRGLMVIAEVAQATCLL